MPMQNAAQVLRDNMNRLSTRDQDFASSLLSNRRPSPRVAHWIGELATRATAPRPGQPSNRNIAGLSSIVDMMRRAAERLKSPKVLFAAGDRQFRLSIAGAQSSQPGAINVCSADGGFEDREWFGRIGSDGTFEPSRKADAATASAVGDALLALAANPDAAAAAYGRRFGCCCFCNRDLTDKRSVDAGYGPICAERFGLAY